VALSTTTTSTEGKHIMKQIRKVISQMREISWWLPFIAGMAFAVIIGVILGSIGVPFPF